MTWVTAAVIIIVIFSLDATVDYAIKKKFSILKVFLSGFAFGAVPSLIILINDSYKFIFDDRVSSLGSGLGWFLIALFPLLAGVLSIFKYEQRT
ncbi:hypothetical protein [Marinimicrobium alkaliphilum]|uniref:hypothetical protein n=1 Tax=Marinimicrobium alkaliphilum TaxID=2202654 RepID=UPI000DB9A823|nr:hypothetical protein [Marinimicrobium alkaliphilum]